uniref:Alpha-carbonic anhydrase domain-containing protein n=1 Tax=Poecilia latipinna TaxID=48699 RepID=A0A3B3UVD9_9TELE
MEMHIVTAKKGILPNETLNHNDGLAVLGFFIDVSYKLSPATEDGNISAPWKTFTSYLEDIPGNVKVDNITIDDLIGNVDRTKFYRYMGSLTTPYCNQAVVWTIFQEPIKVHKDLAPADILVPASVCFENSVSQSGSVSSFLLLTVSTSKHVDHAAHDSKQTRKYLRVSWRLIKFCI